MQLTLAPEIRAFRDRVRRFLDDHLDDELHKGIEASLVLGL